MQVVLLGTGNVSRHLGRALKDAGHEILQIYGRNEEKSFEIASQLETSKTTDLDKLSTTGELYIIAVKDDAIKEITDQIKLDDKFIAHTSGTVSMDILQTASTNYGVFYPLQTFSQNNDTDFNEIPICIEANNEATKKALLTTAQSISQNVHEIDSEKRKIIHLAAVFACNFSNNMYAIAGKLLNQAGLDLDILKPLITETARKIKDYPPKDVQTGPAIRDDEQILHQHLEMLNSDPELKEIYLKISESIKSK